MFDGDNNQKTLTAEEYLEIIIAKNPAIGRPDEETVTLKARGVRALIRQAHAKGEEHGRRLQKEAGNDTDIFNCFFRRQC